MGTQQMTEAKLLAGAHKAAKDFINLAADQELPPAFAIAGLALALGILLGRVSDDEAHLEQGCTATAAQVRHTAGLVFATGEPPAGSA